MKRIIEWGLRQSVFTNLIISYLIVQVIVIILLDTLFRINFTALDRFIMSTDLTSVIEAIDGYSAYDFNVDLVRDGIEIAVKMPQIAIPLQEDSRGIVRSIKPNAEYFLVSCELSTCGEFSSLFYVLPDGSLNIDDGAKLVRVPLIHGETLWNKEITVSMQDFLRILKDNISFYYSIRAFVLFLKESTIIIGSQLLGSAVLMIILSYSLLEATVVFVVTRLFCSEKFGDVFTFTNLLNSFVFCVFFALSSLLNLKFDQIWLFKLGVIVVFVSVFMLWYARGRDQAAA